MTIDEIIGKIIDICRDYSAKTVVLYGSRAKGTALERNLRKDLTVIDEWKC